MNPFDHFIKQELRFKYYIRYADDFVFLSPDRSELEQLLEKSRAFLSNELALDLHPDKIFLKTIASGMDFLGWTHFPHHRVLRSKTRQRMMKRMIQNPTETTLQSYLGMLEHGNSYGLQAALRGDFWLRSFEN